MGDIFNIFKELRQKGIDVNQIDLLKSAYEHQNLNLEQLKENNTALRESNDLLKEKIAQFENKNAQLKNELESVKKHLPVSRKDDLSNSAIAILEICHERDITKFTELEMRTFLGKGEVETKRAIGELKKKMFIKLPSFFGSFGEIYYYLTQSGLEYMAKLGEVNE